MRTRRMSSSTSTNHRNTSAIVVAGDSSPRTGKRTRRPVADAVSSTSTSTTMALSAMCAWLSLLGTSSPSPARFASAARHPMEGSAFASTFASARPSAPASAPLVTPSRTKQSSCWQVRLDDECGDEREDVSIASTNFNLNSNFNSKNSNFNFDWKQLLPKLPSNPSDLKALEKSVATHVTTLCFSLSFFLLNPLVVSLTPSPSSLSSSSSSSSFSSSVVPIASLFAHTAHAEDELYAKYGNKGLDTSLVDKNCLTNHCSLQAEACLRDDPDCRKGLTCTAKCLGDNSCITGCFARYGTPNLDNLLKCTIEDHECIKVAILEGGADKYGDEPRSPGKTVRNLDLKTMEGTWYKVAGYNPNYDCYACQKNVFSGPRSERMGDDSSGSGSGMGLLTHVVHWNDDSNPLRFASRPADRLDVDVQFSMPRLLPDGSPPPPSGVRESMEQGGLKSVGYNAYSTHETMVFDEPGGAGGNLLQLDRLVLGKDESGRDKVYSRTAHSEGEMFGLKFWENWYILGQNKPNEEEFKFVYYNGKTRQNTYDGAFVYSRTRHLSPATMEKVWQIAKDAGMNPEQFCKIQNSCFDNDDGIIPDITERQGLGSPSNPFRGIIASTKISQFLGVESVFAESNIPGTSLGVSSGLFQGGNSAGSGAGGVGATAKVNTDNANAAANSRPWWKEAGDYLEDPRRHFRLMDSLREDMDWPEYIRERK
mmetsp:Transcript_3059/g.6214  ORF Transcript_3059/g.6214 Transcript_3059/m.6214 type:complete len:708 (-) Transcript_3059:142-2265(-)